MDTPSSNGTPRPSRRLFLRATATGAAALSLRSLGAQPAAAPREAPDSRLSEAIAKLEYLTPAEKFASFGRGDPPPYELSAEKRHEVGLDRETWQLDVVPDPESDSRLENPLSRELGSALNWRGLMRLAETHAVRVLSVMSCTNRSGPCGMGLWEGVPLREVLWQARPTKNVRRLFYYGYHNDDPKQRFQSSLALERVLEDPPGQPPVLLCYKLNGRWLSPRGGAPVRLLVPGEYGNKSVKWLQRVLLTNSFEANDTYAGWNNDTESHLKTCARFIAPPSAGQAARAIALTGLAQVGASGLSKVQYWIHPQGASLPDDDPHFTRAEWRDAEILPPPKRWGGGLPDGKLPPNVLGFDPETGEPRRWPLPYTIAHWAALVTVPQPGAYELRCRAIDANGIPQPMPRPFPKSGRNEIEKVDLQVRA